MSSETPVGLPTLQSALARWFADDTRQGLFAIDTQFKVVVWNRWMEIHTGRLADDARGRLLFDLFPEAAERGVPDYYEQALTGHVTVVSQGLHRFLLSMPSTRADLGLHEMPQSGHIGPLFDGGTLIGVLTIIEDVSDRLASEAELRRQIDAQQFARATAEKALRAKDEFLSTLSHEMRTPLNAVLGWARILRAREDVDRELLDRALPVIERNAAAQAKMIDDMLDMARIVAGKLRLEMQPVDLMSVALSAVDVVMPSATGKRIAVQTNLDPSTPHVIGDQDRLQQMIWNLLSNALKFTEPGGTIEVRLEGIPGAACITIRDTGQGITPEFLPYVFDRFRQNDASSTRRHGGLGLGLALVRELVDLHGGTVRAASDGQGKGATFTIVLPEAYPLEMSDAAGSRPFNHDSAAALEGVRVLLVEDEVDSRDLVSAALRQCSANVVAVASTAAAVASLLAAPADALPHVLVSDLGMPRQDGYDLIRQVRTLQPARGGRIPAIALTGYANPDDRERALAAGYQLHLSKPVDPAQLVAAIARLAHGTA